MGKRLLIVGLVITFLLGVCLLRVSYLSSNGFEMLAASDDQATKTLTVARVRGTVYDRHLQKFTNAESEVRAVVLPHAPTVALEAALGETAFLSVAESLQAGKPVAVSLSQWLPPTDGVVQFEVPLRYGERPMAAHVIGYTDSTGTAGVTGVEYACDRLLAKASGEIAVSFHVNGLGKIADTAAPTVRSTAVSASAGVALTLDARLQRLAETCATMTRGAVLITDPYSGEILSMVSRPDYDPNDLETAINAADSPLINRAITDYNCGSVFKMVTAAAALEAGIPTTRRYTCTGKLTMGDTDFHCHHLLGHGEVTMAEAFAVSCNPYFIQLAEEVGAARLYDMAATLGFGRALTLCEGWQTARAVLPSLSDLLKSPAELANLSFGQGGLLATPLHVAAVVGTVVADGIYTPPTLLAGTVDATGSLVPQEKGETVRVFSTATAATLREMMVGVMTDGTGESAKPRWLSAAAKTGTAETGWYEDGAEVIQNWIVGYFPAESPRYTVSVLVENSEAAGETAAPIFKKLCEELYFFDLENTRG